MRRHLRLLAIQIRTSLLGLLQYRFDFFVEGYAENFPFVYPDEYFFRVFGAERAERAYYAPLDVAPEMNRRMADVAAGATFFDPLALLCQGGECLFRQGALYLFYDYGHYTHYGSRRVVNALLDAVAGATPASARVEKQ